MPDHPQHRKINPLAIIAVILILLALGMLFLIFAPGPRMKWALTMGEKYLTDCEYTQAVTMFSRAIRVDDRSEPAYWGRAQAYVQLGDSAAATSDLTYIIDEIGTENADVYLTRADLYMDMGDYDAAQADLDAAASLGADTTAQTAQLDAMTRITVSLPTQIVSYAQFTGGTVTMQYNADGVLTDCTTNYYDVPIHYTYDEHGNVTMEDYNGSVENYVNTYDENGNLLTRAIAGGAVIDVYTYDEHGKVVRHEPLDPIEGTDFPDTSEYGRNGVAYTKTYTYTNEDYTEERDYTDSVERRTYRTYSLEGVLRKEVVYTRYEGVNEYKSQETYCYLGKPFLTNYYNENGRITRQRFWKCDFDTSYAHHIMLTEYHDVTQLESIGFERFRYDESRKEFADFGDDYGNDSVTYYTYTYDDDGNIIGRTAYTDGELSEEVTYTVMQVPKDYNFDTETEADYMYKNYIMVN